MIHHRFASLLLAPIFLVVSSSLAPAQDDGSGIAEAMAIEELAEEGVKAAVIAGVLSGAEAEQLGEAAEQVYDSPDERSDDPGEVDREFIGMLGEMLKSEVEQGRMSESDGWSIYLASVADVRTWYAEQEAAGREVTTPWSQRPTQAGGLSTLALLMSGIDGDHSLQELIRPEYLRRDVRFLAAELRLDADTANIYELLVADYLDGYQREVDRFFDQVDRGLRQGAVETLDQSLARLASVQLESLDWNEIRRRNPWMEKSNGGARLWIEDSIGNFQQVIGGIREDLAAQRMDLVEGGDVLTPAQCVDALRQLRRTREAMRGELEEQMRAFVPEGREAVFAASLDELERERIISAVTLSGVRHDFESALRTAEGIRSFEALSQDQVALLDDSSPLVLASAIQWMDALLDAEVAGYLMIMKSKASGGDVADADLSNYARAQREETERQLILRDTVQGLFQKAQDSIGEHDPDLAGRFRLAGWRQGFPVQMRTRWTERAIKAVLEFEDLDPDLIESIIEFEQGMQSQLAMLRQQAIQECLVVEARVARIRSQQLMERKAGLPIDLVEVVREPVHDRFLELDDRTAAFLESILAEDQFARLPRRPGTRLAEWDRKEGRGKDGGKGGGKGGGKDGGKGNAKGSGKGTAGKGGGKGGGKGK